MSVVNAISLDEIEKLIDQSENLLSRYQTMLKTQFRDENIRDLEEELEECYQKYCYYLSEKGEGIAPSEKEVIDDIFEDILAERQKLQRIYDGQKVIETLQWIKRKFFHISQLDTCKKDVTTLKIEAQEFEKNLEANEYLKKCCPDLLTELKVLIERIEADSENIKTQFLIEAVSGGLTILSFIGSLILGIVGIVGRTIESTASAGGVAIAVAVDAVETAGATAANLKWASKLLAFSENFWAKFVLKVLDICSTLVSGVCKLKERNILKKVKQKLTEALNFLKGVFFSCINRKKKSI